MRAIGSKASCSSHTCVSTPSSTAAELKRCENTVMFDAEDNDGNEGMKHEWKGGVKQKHIDLVLHCKGCS